MSFEALARPTPDNGPFGKRKRHLKVFDLEGTVLEADEEDEAGGGGAGTPKPDPQSEPDPLEAKWKSIAAQVLAAIKKVKGTPGIDLQETIALWGVAVKQAEAGAFTKALTSVQQVATLLKSTAGAEQAALMMALISEVPSSPISSDCCR
ncbi:MAG: hypothetical protein L3J65_08435 [Robiginitomaculum sp.]|nr:hypothetical protein [Robiginitomaculum sp.]